MNAPARFLRSIHWQRWCWVAFAGFALTVAYEVYYTYQVLPRVYTGIAIMKVKPWDAPQQKGALEVMSPPSTLDLLKSDDFLLPIIEKLNLDEIWARRVFQTQITKLPPADALGFLRSHLKVYPRGHLIGIQVFSELPQEAADIANAVADRYQTLREVTDDQVQTRKRVALRDQLTDQQSVLDSRRQAGNVSEIAAQQAIIDGLKAQIDQAQKEAEMAATNHAVEIVHRAAVPERPTLPDYRFENVMALPKGLCVGIWLATLVELAIYLAMWSATTPWNKQWTRNASAEY